MDRIVEVLSPGAGGGLDSFTHADDIWQVVDGSGEVGLSLTRDRVLLGPGRVQLNGGGGGSGEAHAATHATGGTDLLTPAAIGAATTTALTDGLATKVGTGDARLTDTRTPTDASVTDAKVAAGAAIALTKLAGLVDGGGKIVTTLLPGLAITSTTVVATEAAMLALTAQEGDVAIRSDLSKTFILGSGASTLLASWNEILTPTGGGVTSVAGRTGAVVLAIADVSTLQTALDAKLASNDASVTNTRTPTDLSVTDAKVAAAAAIAQSKIAGLVDALLGKLSSTDPSVTNSRPPNGAAGGSFLNASYPNPGMVSGSITGAEIAAAIKDAAAATASLRTLGTGAAQAAAGDDARLSDARTPTAHGHVQADVTALTADLAAKSAIAQVNVYTASGTFTPPAGAKSYDVVCVGQGGGGGSGRRGATSTVRCGGGGGGGGAVTRVSIPASVVGAGAVTITVDPATAGGEGATVDSTDGAPGGGSVSANTTSTSFGMWARALNGGRGGGGTVSTGTAGQAGSAAMFGGSAGAAASVTGTAGNPSVGVGAGATGGGSGAGLSSANAASAGGNAGPIYSHSGNTGGTGGAVGNSGTASTNAPGADSGLPGAGGGGGGSAVSAAGGAGGAGAFPGAGGGGGSASLDGQVSGAGGAGGGGVVVVITHF